MKIPELLAPAGSYTRAKAAFLYGADAVYVGTAALSLRTRTDMEMDELEKIVNLAKSLNKKVYVAMNIYAMDSDYEKIKEQCEYLEKLKVDALIISDGGVLECAKKYAPSIPKHISTQANIVSVEACKFWQKNGAERVILARELSREKIKHIMENKPEELEVEIFIHGAVCMGYSGRCILSNYLMSRSSNLGDCAQPCRWEYNAYVEEVKREGVLMPVEEDKKGTYIFSAKDLCLIKRIPEIVEMGIDSLKIEGRLKTEYYVATVVNTYRRAIDDYINNPEEWDYVKYFIELEKAKSRGASELFYDDEYNLDIQSFDGDERSTIAYEYAAVVKDDEGDKTLVEIRNRIAKGDKLEVIIPGNIDNQEFIVEKMYDAETKEDIDFVNPGKQGQSVYLELPCEVKEGYIIRKRKNV